MLNHVAGIEDAGDEIIEAVKEDFAQSHGAGYSPKIKH